MIKRLALTFALLLVLLLTLVAWRGRGDGKLRPTRTPTPSPAPVGAPDVTPSLETPGAPANSPPCVMDWSLPVSDENYAALFACYQQIYPPGTPGFIPPFCPPSANSPWVPMFWDNAACWLTLFGLPSMTPWTMTPSATPAQPISTPPPPYP